MKSATNITHTNDDRGYCRLEESIPFAKNGNGNGNRRTNSYKLINKVYRIDTKNIINNNNTNLITK